MSTGDFIIGGSCQNGNNSDLFIQIVGSEGDEEKYIRKFENSYNDADYWKASFAAIVDGNCIGDCVVGGRNASQMKGFYAGRFKMNSTPINFTDITMHQYETED